MLPSRLSPPNRHIGTSSLQAARRSRQVTVPGRMRRSATWLASTASASVRTRPTTPPRTPPSAMPAIRNPHWHTPRMLLRTARVRKSPKPTRAPVCTPLIVPKRTSPVATCSSAVRCGARSTLDAITPEHARSTNAITAPEISAMVVARVAQRPVFTGSVERNSATNLVAASPSPAPATMPNRPWVLWIMAISPKPVVPRRRPATTDDASVRPRDTTAPTSAQNAPIAKCLAVESPGTAEMDSPLLAALVTAQRRVGIAIRPRPGSGQQALDLPAHAVDLFRRHVRVQRQGQGFPARGHGVLHPLAHPMRHAPEEGLLVHRRIEVALGLDPARREPRVHRVPAGP